MSPKRKTNGSTENEATSTEVGKTGSADGSGREQEIRIRAYEFYLERGGEPGRELDDWLQAERELAINEPTSLPE